MTKSEKIISLVASIIIVLGTLSIIGMNVWKRNDSPLIANEIAESSYPAGYETVSENEEFNVELPIFDGETLKTDDYTIRITDYKILKPGDLNNISNEHLIAFWFDVTVNENATSKEYNPNTAWIFAFEAIQDNDPNAINTLNVGFLPDAEYLDSQMKTIKPGGTVSSAMSYELTDLTTPVTLSYSKMFGSEVASYNYEIK